jgi:hypothetical protein
VKSRISGKDSTYVAREALKRRPIRLMAPEGVEEPPNALVPSEGSEQAREAPPRVLKPSALNDQCVAPRPDLESHRKRLREAFGNTMSDEFVDVLLGKLVEALRPGSLEALDEVTVNAALATIHSMYLQTELEALLAVEIIAAGFYARRMLAAWQPPPEVKRILIFGDNDPGYAGQAAAYALARRLGSDKYAVEVHVPADPGADWNGVHRLQLNVAADVG